MYKVSYKETLGSEGKGREGKGREGKEREGKGDAAVLYILQYRNRKAFWHY